MRVDLSGLAKNAASELQDGFGSSIGGLEQLSRDALSVRTGKETVGEFARFYCLIDNEDEARRLDRLSKAAPDLLAALEAICDASPVAASLPADDAKPFSEAYAAARAAIAKAKG